jgi:hypothetical protein
VQASRLRYSALYGLGFLIISMQQKTKAAPKEAPDCGRCVHYYITYEASFPYACRVLGFKSKRKPHLDVLEASGEHCRAYQPRNKPDTSKA